MSNHLRDVLDSMFPDEYLKHNHPIGACTLLELKCRKDHCELAQTESSISKHICQVSIEPGNRVRVRSLAVKLDITLKSHSARPNGLCPIRRAIYDQCFDELIRQTTINCLESGLLLFRVKNELKATINTFKFAYESGVRFGLRKSLCAELRLQQDGNKIHELESEVRTSAIKLSDQLRSDELERENKADSSQRMRTFYEKEVAKRDQIIDQQRGIIKSLSQNIVSQMATPSQQKQQL